jgi:hypothetical protein
VCEQPQAAGLDFQNVRDEWDGKFPPSTGAGWFLHQYSVYPEYLTGRAIIVCPSDADADPPDLMGWS